MKLILITGASSGIGLATAKKLIDNRYRVIGVARDFNKCDFNNKNFIKLQINLLESDSMEIIKKRVFEIGELDILINNAGVGYFNMHEDLNSSKIKELVNLNLTTPMLLSNIFIKQIKKRAGKIINIASASALKPSPFGSAYSATKAGLIQFSNSLFEELRKSGASSIVISPDMTDTAFFDKISFYPSSDKLSRLIANDIAEQILWILNQPKNVVITDLVIKPQKFKIEKR